MLAYGIVSYKLFMGKRYYSGIINLENYILEFWIFLANGVLSYFIINIWYVTQRELMMPFEGDIKTDILNSPHCSIYKEHFDTKMIFISYSYQKL